LAESSSFPLTRTGHHRSRTLCPLAVCLGGIITLVHNQILWAVIVLSTQVRLEDRLGSIGVSLLGIEGGPRHVWHHGVATTKGVLCIAEGVVLRSGLGEPDITPIATEVTRLEGVGYILLDDDGATSGVDEPRS
jgi:hypothetical protein